MTLITTLNNSNAKLIMLIVLISMLIMFIHLRFIFVHSVYWGPVNVRFLLEVLSLTDGIGSWPVQPVVDRSYAGHWNNQKYL